MNAFELLALMTTLAALFGWLNHRYLALPTAIGLTALALAFSLALVGVAKLGLPVDGELRRTIEALELGDTLLGGMLGALLFAGALHIDLGDLARQRGVIAFSATAGVALSALLVAGAAWAAFGALGLDLPFAWCLVFGALISPTDPVAVLAILRQARVPPTLQTKIAGESLFNDGVGIVLFLVAVELAVGSEVGLAGVGALLLREALGGVAFGMLLGWLGYRMLRGVDNAQVEVLVTLALVTGGYAAAHALHTSGPLAMVVAGLFIGNHGRAFAMSEQTRRRLDDFWELADELLNAILFVMIGLEVIVIAFDGPVLAAGLIAIPIALLARGASVGSALGLLGLRRSFSDHAAKIMTWGGLRGGISVALALSLPPGPWRSPILAVTYTVVCFSIIVQGLTIGPLVARLYPGGAQR